MRNILEYPITDEDRLNVLTRLYEEFINDPNPRYGSLDGVVLDEYIQELKKRMGINENNRTL